MWQSTSIESPSFFIRLSVQAHESMDLDTANTTHNNITIFEKLIHNTVEIPQQIFNINNY